MPGPKANVMCNTYNHLYMYTHCPNRAIWASAAKVSMQQIELFLVSCTHSMHSGCVCMTLGLSGPGEVWERVSMLRVCTMIRSADTLQTVPASAMGLSIGAAPSGVLSNMITLFAVSLLAFGPGLETLGIQVGRGYQD